MGILEDFNNENLLINHKHPDPNHCHNYWGVRWHAMAPGQRAICVDFIRRRVDPRLLEDIRSEIQKDREYWWVRQHLTWGVQFRNFLRQNGFTEQMMGIMTWDDYYGSVVEIAVMGDDWYDDVPVS
jgi:hypothetical protein